MIVGQARGVAEAIADRLSAISGLKIYPYPRNLLSIGVQRGITVGSVVLTDANTPKQMGRVKGQEITFSLDILTGSDTTGDEGQSAEWLLGDLISSADDFERLTNEKTLYGKLHDWPEFTTVDDRGDVVTSGRIIALYRPRSGRTRWFGSRLRDGSEVPYGDKYEMVEGTEFKMQPRIESFNIDRRVLPGAAEVVSTVLSADIMVNL